MTKFLIVMIIGAAFYYFLTRPVPSPAPPPGPVAATAQRAAGTARTLTPSWPPAGDEKVAVSPDLFAKNYYIVLDGSGSMAERSCAGSKSKMETAKAALAVFAQSLPANANLGLQVFDDRGVKERLPLGTENRDQFIRVVNQARASGGTPLRDSVAQAYAKLLEQGQKQLGYGEYHLVIVTDGEANAGQEPTAVVDRLLRDSPVVLYTIGFCIGTNHSLNQPGRTVYKAADNADDLRQGLSEVLAEAPQFSVTTFK